MDLSSSEFCNRYSTLVSLPNITKKYKCKKCRQNPDNDANHTDDIEKCNIRCAAYPQPMIPHSFCSPELAAHIIYEKFAKAVPFYRLLIAENIIHADESVLQVLHEEGGKATTDSRM